MYREKERKKYRLVYSLGEHPYLGFLIEPHVVLLNPNGELSFTHKRLFSSTAAEYEGLLDDTDRQLVKLLDEIEQSHIIKRYHKKAIRPADYFTKVFNKEIFEFIRPKIEDRLLKVMGLLPGKALYLMGKDGYPADQPLRIAQETASVLFHFRRNETETRYFPTIRYKGNRIEFMYRDAQVIINQQAWLLLDRVLYHFDQALEGRKLSPFLQKRYISVPKTTEYKYFESFVCGLIERHHVYAEGFDIITHQHEASPVLRIGTSGTDPAIPELGLAFRYGPNLFPFAQDTKVTVRMAYDAADDHYTFHRIRRSLAWEQKRMDELQTMGLHQVESGSFGLLDWLQQHQETLRDKGFEILQEEEDGTRYFFGKTDISFEVNESNDWFDVHAVARFGSYEIPFIQLKDHILSGERQFRLPSGEIALIPEEWLARFSELFHFSQAKQSLRLKKMHLGLLQELSENQALILERRIGQLQDFTGMEHIPQPEGLKGQLRPYQQAGLNWFYFLRRYRFGGCLADDMGLGKTIQALALLQKEKEAGAAVSLIIMPTSLIYNWQQEAARFVPDLRLYVHTGTQRERDPGCFAGYDAVITTYGIARIDEELFRAVYFHYIILDESQHIKNPASKSFKVVRSFKSAHRLALTGTPVENSVADLWSQMAFLNPGLLGTQSYFQQEFILPIEKKKDGAKAQRLQAMVKPFLLRRTKAQVAAELPAKSEQTIYCEMGEEQKEYYERIKSEYRNVLLEAGRVSVGEAPAGQVSGKETRKAPQILLLQGLTKLRQISNHPVLVDSTYIGPSGKFEQVLLHLESVLQRGNKVLIFSQFVRQLELYRDYFDQQEIPYAYLDGSTTDRGSVVERFRTDDQVRLFLISIKAGGVGLNLTEADYVFVLDPWWNPAVEQQAIDRAHRIGQKRNVFIYKFISKDTVEEKILALQDRKARIAGNLIPTEESFFKSLSTEDIRALLD